MLACRMKNVNNFALTKPKREIFCKRCYYSGMTINQYIEKHGLKLCGKYPDTRPMAGFTPSVLVSRQPNDFDPQDRFEIYGNEDRTHFVSINVTAGLFRIVHVDMIMIASDWQPTRYNYELQRSEGFFASQLHSA